MKEIYCSLFSAPINNKIDIKDKIAWILVSHESESSFTDRFLYRQIKKPLPILPKYLFSRDSKPGCLV